jgi:hypothetical protein
VLLDAGVRQKSAWAALRLYRRKGLQSADAIPVAEDRRGRKIDGGFRLRARAALLPYTMPTCRWSFQQKAPLQTLTGSVASIHRNAREINEKISYSSLCRIASISHRCPLGIGAMSKNTDKCPVDAVWDRVAGPRTKKRLKEILETIEGADATYFNNFSMRSVYSRCNFDSQMFTGEENLDFVDKLAAYFLDKSSTTADPELQALEAVALADLQGPDGIRALVEEFSTHWKLRDFLASALSLDTSEPLALTTYYLEDWKDYLKMVKS